MKTTPKNTKKRIILIYQGCNKLYTSISSAATEATIITGETVTTQKLLDALYSESGKVPIRNYELYVDEA